MKPDGSYKTHSTPEGYRCALLNYYSSEGIPIPKQFQKPLNGFINGVKNSNAQSRRNGTYKETEGKDALRFGHFQAMCKNTLLEKYVEGHLFMIMLWNMVSKQST
jgi:hypothetical protein